MSSSASKCVCVSHHMFLDAQGVGFEFLSPTEPMWLLGWASVFSRVFKRWNEVKEVHLFSSKLIILFGLFNQQRTVVLLPSGDCCVCDRDCVCLFLNALFQIDVSNISSSFVDVCVFFMDLIGVMSMIIAPPGLTQAGWNILYINFTCNLLRFLCSKCKGQMGQFETAPI